MNPRAILFDLDGTLVDTITLYGEAVLASLKEVAGIDATWEQYREWYGRPLHLKGILALYGLTDEGIPGIRKRRDELYIDFLRTKTAWYPGAKDLLSGLRAKGVPVGLVTGSWMSYVEAIDSLLGVKKHFDAFVTVDDMGDFTKPHPHGLLLGADRLGVDPRECVYVGDQRFDIEAAERAGMPGILIRSEWTPADASAPQEVRSVSELSEVLRKMLAY